MNCAFSNAVLLEAMDQTPPILGLWLGALTFGLGAFVAARWRWWASLPFVAILILRATAIWWGLQDPLAGPAALREVGLAYRLHFAFSTSLGGLLAVVGIMLPKRAA